MPMRYTPAVPSGTFLWSVLLLESREADTTDSGSGQGGSVPGISTLHRHNRQIPFRVSA